MGGGSSGLSFLFGVLKACSFTPCLPWDPGGVINCLATAPSHGHLSFYHFPFCSFRGHTVWSKSPYPQHCQQREGNTSVGSHGPVDPNEEHRESISGGPPELPDLDRKKKRPAAGSMKKRADLLLQQLWSLSWITFLWPGQPLILAKDCDHFKTSICPLVSSPSFQELLKQVASLAALV